MAARVWPAPVAPGAVVRVVAPAGPVDPGRLEAGVGIIASWGLTARVGGHVLTTDQRLPHLAGSDDLRATEFTAAWLDPGTAAVWAARGGYGTQRILDLLDWDRLRAAGPKHLIGFSDVTALHGRLGRELGQVTIHGPGVTALSQLRDEQSAAALRALLTEVPAAGQTLAEGRTSDPGVAEGRLWGGNLTLLAGDAGIEPPPAEDVVLVIEDVAEPAYRVDRLLTQLRRAGHLDRVRGVLVGDLGTGDTRSIVADRLGGRGIPVVVDAPVGHGSRNVALPLGAPVRLDASGPMARLTLA